MGGSFASIASVFAEGSEFHRVETVVDPVRASVCLLPPCVLAGRIIIVGDSQLGQFGGIEVVTRGPHHLVVALGVLALRTVGVGHADPGFDVVD